MKSRWWLGGLTVDPHMLRTLLQTEFFIVVFLMHAAVTISRREREPERARERERKIEPERESRGPQSLHILGQTPLFKKNISTISPTAYYHIFNYKNEPALEPPFLLPPIKR